MGACSKEYEDKKDFLKMNKNVVRINSPILSEVEQKPWDFR